MAQADCLQDVTVTPETIERQLREIEFGCRALAPIEWMIVEGLRAKPVHLWCRGQVLLLRGLHKKATGG